jgi:1-deoxy-D-xylulose-5-phosphate reductoisomerase
MRVPIAYALHWPERVDVPVRALDLAELGALTFEPVDAEAFPCLTLAREAGLAGGTAPCVLNAANEVAVHAFLEGTIGFLDIPRIVEATLERLPGAGVHAFGQLFEVDREARLVARDLAQSVVRP